MLLRLASLLLASLSAGYAQAAAQLPAPDPQITAAISQISSARLKANVEHLIAFGTRNSFSEKLGPKRGVFAARDWIMSELQKIAATSLGRMRVSLDSYIQMPDGRRIARPVEISSVIAELRGDEPGGRTYVISSHYDSRNSTYDDISADAPGADDNGSGTAAVLEAARVMAQMPVHATVIFAIYDAEEQGLLGSAHHAQSLQARHVDVQGNLNNDIIGASRDEKGEVHAHSVRIFSESLPLGSDVSRINALGSENDSPSRQLARFAKEAGDHYIPDLTGNLIFRADRFLRGGDHQSFNAAGYAGIRFVEPTETFAHQHQNPRTENGVRYGDFAEFMDFDYLLRVTQYNVAVLATLARGPGLVRDCAILTKELTNDSSLSWSPVAGATHYEVMRRLTTEPVWTQIDDVGAVTRATLPYSKDNWLFGVRAVDADGHRGVVASPSPKQK